MAVAGLAARAAEFYGYPQDIEWAYGANDSLFLLQSRNVTRLPPYWTRDESAERFPNVVTPLTWDLVEDGFHKSLKHSLSLMGMPPFNGLWFGLHDNYVYGNETIVRLYKGMAPDLPDDIGLLVGQLPSLLEKFAWVVELPGVWFANLDRYLLELGRLQAVPLSALTEEELWEHVLEINDLGTWYFLPNIAISLAHHLLASMMKRLCVIAVGEAKGEAQFCLLLSGTETRTGQINHQMFGLAQQVRDDEKLRALLEATAARRVIETDALARFPVFREAFQRFLALFGNREIDFDPYHPSWGEAPWIVLDQVCVVAGSEEEFVAAAELERRSKARAAEHDFLVEIPAEIRPYAADLWGCPGRC